MWTSFSFNDVPLPQIQIRTTEVWSTMELPKQDECRVFQSFCENFVAPRRLRRLGSKS